ncbi:MAG: hypothetical protein JXR75_04360 [Rhodobacteraceae bacterium]|nr:hypothetical protein [Paracoccaceae bacterium]
MSGYVYAGVPSPLGMYDDLHHQRKTERLRALFEAGVPVIASGDGLTATPAPNSSPRPPRDTWNDSAPVDGDGELGAAEW